MQNRKEKLRVGVLMGGRSIEREVSFNSGRTVCDHLDSARFEVIPLFQTCQGSIYKLPWRFLHRGKTTDFVESLEKETEKISWDALKDLVDFVYLALHGRYAEDGTVQGLLEVLKIPYLGSKVWASAVRAHKVMQKHWLSKAGIKVPLFTWFTCSELSYAQNYGPERLFEKLTEGGITFPVVCKPIAEGSSLGVSVVQTQEELLTAVWTASWIDERYQQAVIVEEKIEGMEFSCVVITDVDTGNLRALPPTEIIPEGEAAFFDYDQKYMPGRAIKITPARCFPDDLRAIQQAAIITMQALEMSNVGRIDGFLTADKSVVIIDPNAISGTDPVSFIFRQAAEIGMSHTQLINHLIDTELKAYGMNSTFSTERQCKNQQKIRVAVLLGGASNEREVSLESGRNIVYKLSPQRYEAYPIFVDEQLGLHHINQQLLVRHSTQEIKEGLDSSMALEWSTLPEIVDFVFIGLHGGCGEDGSIQGALGALGVPYNGSGVLTSSLCMNKFKTTQFLKSHGFDVPKGILLVKEEWKDNKQSIIEKCRSISTGPLIVKPHDDGCSVLVYKVATDDEIAGAITNVIAAGKSAVLVEECVMGMELTVGVIGNDTPQALPPSQAVATSGVLSIKEKFLPGAGQNLTPAPLALEDIALVQRTMEDAYRILNCRGYARIDCFFQEATETDAARVVILEVNTLPALTPATCIFHQAAECGIQPMDFIDMIVQFGLEEHKKEGMVSINSAQLNDHTVEAQSS